MENIIIVKIKDPDKYQPFAKRYGLLVDSMECTAGIMWDSTHSGVCTRVSHEDYTIVSPYMWEIFDHQIIIPCCGGYLNTGLRVY